MNPRLEKAKKRFPGAKLGKDGKKKTLRFEDEPVTETEETVLAGAPKA